MEGVPPNTECSTVNTCAVSSIVRAGTHLAAEDSNGPEEKEDEEQDQESIE